MSFVIWTLCWSHNLFVKLWDRCYEMFWLLELQTSEHKIPLEKQSGGKLAFLDILISNESDNICASVFRKKTSIGLYTNFASFTPFWYKIGLIKALLNRAFQISSSILPMILAIKKKCFRCCDIWTKRVRYPKALCCSCIARKVDRMKHWQSL